MSSRAAEHAQWNLSHGLAPDQELDLVCPRCAGAHVETLTSLPSEPVYWHHVHQCSHCGLRFDLFVRNRATGAHPAALADLLDAIDADPAPSSSGAESLGDWRADVVTARMAFR